MTAKIHKTDEHQEAFTLSPENFEQAKVIIARYPQGKEQSALIPLLLLAQRQNANYLSRLAMDYIAQMLSIPPVHVYEVASFYTMFNMKPVGRYMIEVCTNTPCWLRDSDSIVSTCEKKLGIKLGETTQDGMFTLKEAECLGSCVTAPMCQVGANYYEDLTPESVARVIDTLALGQEPKTGTQSDRKSSEPASGLTTLKLGAS